MDLLVVNAKIENQVNINLKYIDNSEFNYILHIGDIVKFAYLKNEKISIIEGKVVAIEQGPTKLINLNNDDETNDYSYATIYLDMSKENESHIEKIISSQIRGVNDTAEKYLDPEPSQEKDTGGTGIFIPGTDVNSNINTTANDQTPSNDTVKNKSNNS